MNFQSKALKTAGHPPRIREDRSQMTGPVLDRQTENNDAEMLAGLLSKVETKLTVGCPDDPLEREAEEAADPVMTMPEPVVRKRPG